MSICLDFMARDFGQRMNAFEGMLEHLQINPTDDEAASLLPELRAALLACGGCQTPGRCTSWCRGSIDRAPGYCPGKQDYEQLGRALSQIRQQTA